MGGPEFEFRVTGGPQPHQVRVSFRDDVDSSDDLGMAAVEPFSEPQHRGQRANRPPKRTFQHPVALVRFLRRRLSMIARKQRDNLDLLGIEAAQLSVLDQIV